MTHTTYIKEFTKGDKNHYSFCKLNELYELYKSELFEKTLPFWINNCVDKEFGGFTMALDRQGKIIDTDKGMWQQGRFTWLLGHLYNNYSRDEEWLSLVEHGIKFIDSYGFDTKDGRMWFHVTQDGKPIRKRRYSFTETFACIAYAEYAKATGSNEYKSKAIDLFSAYQNFLDSPQENPKFEETRPTIGIGRYMIDIVTLQILRETIEFEKANEIIDNCIAVIEKLFVKDDIKCVMETVTPEGEILDHFDGRMLNPGHAIECAWFIMKEGIIRQNDRYKALGCKMLDWMWERGWDKEFGGILYFRDVYDKPVQEYWQDMKFWWPQNETVIATLMAYSITGDCKYAKMHKLIHDWTFAHFPDEEYGEWYGYLHRDGSVSTDLKGNLWKGPFHMPRMNFECMQTIHSLRERLNA